jgi:large conductance mechanosensitive channel
VIKGFKDFVLRGNVVDLAVAFVLGVAFATVVTAFTQRIIQPMINALGGSSRPGLGFFIRSGQPNTFVDIGGVISAVINFLLVAAVLYFVVIVPIAKLQQRRDRGQAEADAVPTEDIVLLTEIRDLLSARSV